MAELRNTCKKILLEKDDLSSRSFSNNLYSPANHSKAVKKTCTSLEVENSSYEEYTLKYSIYLLRKAQNKLLAENKSSKEENIKKCFVSLKLEFEELLTKYLQLNKELMSFKSYFDTIRETKKKILDGKKLLESMRESKFENLLKSLSGSLDNIINQLQLADIDKNLIEEALEKNVLGSGCELEACLKEIDSCISKNKNQISNIAEESKKLRQLGMKNLIFKEKFASLCKSIFDEVLETNYNFCINAVKKAFTRRKDKTGNLDLEFDIAELDQFNKVKRSEHTLELSELESLPKSSSTPQPESS